MMLRDIWTVFWKETREHYLQRPSLKGSWLGMFLFVVVFGVILPLQFGRDWIASPLTLAFWSWIPFLLVNSVIANSIAGERERHTLETLLASRLSDRSILLGKVLSAVAYGWGLTQVSALVGVVVVNIAYWQGTVTFFPPQIAVAIAILTFLVALFAAGIGIQVSLRAATVQQAQQALGVAFFILFIPLMLLPSLPDAWQLQLANSLRVVDAKLLVASFVGGLVLLDVALLVAALLRFKRSRLILD